MTGAVVGTGLHVVGNNFLIPNSVQFVYATPYQSTDNNANPVTAPASYVVNIPDANLRTVLNRAIATANGTTRADNAQIAAGEMRTLVDVMSTLLRLTLTLTLPTCRPN